MRGITSDDWLPPGWTIEHKVRKSGKKDKLYVAPCGKRKFYSRARALCYLDLSMSCSGFKEKTMYKQLENSVGCKQNANDNQSGNSASCVVLEKVKAPELPPGWIKEIRARKYRDKTRKDTYYIEPASKYVFRSMKEVHRFLETGQRPRRVQKSSGKDCTIKLLEEVENSIPVDNGTKKGTNSYPKIKSKSLKNIETNNQPVKNWGISDQPSYQWELTVDLSCLNQLAAGTSLAKCEEHFDFAKYACISAPAVEVQGKPLSEGAMTSHETNGSSTSKVKREHILSWCASKRLAGIEPDAIPGILASKQTCKFPVKQLDAEVTTEHSVAATGTQQASQYFEHIVPDIKVEEMLEPAAELPIGNFLQDPCIEFAVKTLTGSIDITSHASTHMGIQERKNPNDCMVSMVNVKDQTKKVENESITATFPSENLASIEPARRREVNKCDKKPGLPGDSHLESASRDPYIEFAIKTLTGANPIEHGMYIKNGVHQQLNSLDAETSNGLALPKASPEAFCGADI